MEMSEHQQEGGRGEVLASRGCGGCRGPGNPLRGDAEGERQRTGGVGSRQVRPQNACSARHPPTRSRG